MIYSHWNFLPPNIGINPPQLLIVQASNMYTTDNATTHCTLYIYDLAFMSRSGANDGGFAAKHAGCRAKMASQHLF